MARTKDFDEEEVLNKAVCLFWQKGFNGTSMQELVDHLNISRSSLYDTYVDKRTLYLKALSFYQGATWKRFESMLAHETSATATIKKLLELITSDLLSDRQHKGCFMVNAEVEVAPHDTDVKEIVQKSEDQIEETFRATIQKGQRSGELSAKKDARALARFFLNTVKGIRVSAKSTPDPKIFQDIIKTAMTVLV